MADAPDQTSPQSAPAQPSVIDIDGARKAGFSDAQIMSAVSARLPGVNVTGARDAGYSDADILSAVSDRYGPMTASQDAPMAITEPGSYSRLTKGSYYVSGNGDVYEKGAAPDGKDAFIQANTPQTSTGQAFVHHAETGAAPAAGGMVTAAAGAKLGALAGAAVPGAGETGIGEVVGGVAGGLLGYLGGATAVEKAQDYLIDHLPADVTKAVGLDKGTRQAEEQQHPIASMAGDIAPNLAFIRPGAVEQVAEDAPKIAKLMSKPLVARGFGATVGATLEGEQEEQSGEGLNPEKLALAAGAGAFMNKETRLGRAAAGAGERLVPNFGGRAPSVDPAQTADTVMQAGSVEDGIAAANAEVNKVPVDIEAEGMKAQAGEEPVPHRDLSGGALEQTADGQYQFTAGNGETHPLRVWDENAPPEMPQEGESATSTIPTDLSQAQRDHYGKLGMKVIYFHNDPAVPFDGAVDPDHPDTLFLSNDPSRNAAQVGAHEFTHALESTTLPDGSTLADMLAEQVKAGLTPAGMAHAQEVFGQSAPAREQFPEGEEGDAQHADAVTGHLIKEMGAEIGGEAPKFRSFFPQVLDTVEQRFGPQVAKDVLQKFMAGVRSAIATMRTFFTNGQNDPVTASQTWVNNLDDIHHTLAQAYAERYGTELQRQQAKQDRANRETARQAQITAAAKVPEKFDDVATFLARQGGVRNDEGHNLVKGSGLQQFVSGAGPLIRPNGMTIDEAGQKLWEAGFFGHPDLMPNGPSEAETLDLLSKTGRGTDGKPTKVYHPNDHHAQADQQLATRITDQNAEYQETANEIRRHAKAFGEPMSDDDVRDVHDRMRNGMDAESAVAEHIERKAMQEVSSDHDQTGDDRYREAATLDRGEGETDRGLGIGGEGPAAAREDEGGQNEAGEPASENPDQARELRAESFKTAKGSTYQVHDDGTTTRDKAARPEHPGEEGIQPRSERTFYVSKEHANELGLFQTHGGEQKAIVERPDRTAGVKYLSGKDSGKFERRTVADVSHSPEVGLIPVETWNGGTSVHFGNEITEVGGDRAFHTTPGAIATDHEAEVAHLEAEGARGAKAKLPPTLFSPKVAREDDELGRDPVSDLIEAVTGEKPEQTPTARMLEKITSAGIKQIKNLNAVESSSRLGLDLGTIFPRTLATLDDMSARLWRTWTARDEEANTNVESLRSVIADSLVDLPAASRDRVYAAVELARKWNWRPQDDGAPIRVKNTSYWQARKSKVGDNYVLSDRETRAFHDVMKLGDEGWKTFMRGLARREGWTGPIDPEAIRQTANESGKGKLPEGKRLLRLASTLEAAQVAMRRPYFPAMRFGDYFIAVRPKVGADMDSTGGYPKVEWFETVEKPALDDILGRARKSGNEAPAVQEALARIKGMKGGDGEVAFPADKYDFEIGDLRSKPGILRNVNIPAIEKLFMLMERGVTQSLKDSIIASGSPDEGLEPKAATELRTQAQKDAQAHYQELLGQTKEALMDAIYQDMLSGWKKQANLVPGYSEDFDRSVGTHLYQVSKNAADLAHRNDIDDAFQNIQDNHPHESVKEYWKHWREYQENPQAPLARVAGKTAQYGAAYVMGMNPATTMAIASHTPMMAVPVLGVGGGMGQATAQMARAIKEVYGALSFDKEQGAHIDTTKLGKTPAEKALLAELDRTGLNHSVGADDLRRINDRQAGLWGKAAPVMRNALDIALSNISAVDQANRNAIALSAFRMAQNPKLLNRMAEPWVEKNAVFREMVKSEGLTPENFAKFMLNEAGGQWGKVNQAPIMRGVMGSLVFALHGFQIRYLSTAIKLAKNMGPAGKIAATWMMAALWAATGVNGLPFFQDGENAADGLWKGMTGVDPMIDAQLHRFLNGALGKIGTEILMRGPLSTMMNVDLGSRLGFGDVVSQNLSADAVLGTYPSMIWNRLSAAYSRERSGQGLGAAAAELLPNALRQPAKAMVEGQQGIVSKKGETMVPADQISLAHQLLRAAGLPPLSTAEAEARSDYVFRLRASQQEVHQINERAVANILVRANQASERGDDDGAQKLAARAAARIESYNKDHWQVPITSQGLNGAILAAVNPEIAHKKGIAAGLRPEAEQNPYP